MSFLWLRPLVETQLAKDALLSIHQQKLTCTEKLPYGSSCCNRTRNPDALLLSGTHARDDQAVLMLCTQGVNL